MTKNCVAELKNGDEALIVLQALGFTSRDWPSIKRLGGAVNLLSSDLLQAMLEKKLVSSTYVAHQLKNLRKFLDQFYEQGGYLITPTDTKANKLFLYPLAPLVFFGHFSQRLIGGAPAVAIVGSRAYSTKTRDLVNALCTKLTQRGIVVVSGGAGGVDTIAHLRALSTLGQTVLVSGVACKPEKRHVLENAPGFDEKRIAVLYPFGPMSSQGKFMFVERNRFVAALADAVVVISGKSSSGTLHTARFAVEHKVPLFALPGALDDALAVAPNSLLASGHAQAVVDFDWFADSLKVSATNPAKKQEIVSKERIAKTCQKAELPYLLEVIDNHEKSLGFDELLQITGKSFLDLQKELLDYELSGRIIKRGSQFVLTGS